MPEKFQELAVVVSQNRIGEEIYDLTLQTKHIAEEADAGQFVALYSADSAKLLPRPISLCGIDGENGTIRLVYRVTGEGTGTEEFSKLEAGDTIRVLGPLGNGFEIKDKRALIVGGGIGIPPMLQLAGQIKNMQPDTEITVVLGYRDAQTFLLDEFEALGKEAEEGIAGAKIKVVVATEDGSVGTKGNVLDAIRGGKLSADVVYACGPSVMLRALKEYALKEDMDCYVSMEERMACGIGACLACVCRTRERDAHSNVNNKRICKEGPVFDAREVEL